MTTTEPTTPVSRHHHDVLAALRRPTQDLRSAIPDAWQGFAALHAGAMADGTLTARTKELMALAIAVTQRCDGCIAAHARGAARQGASDDEVAEALGVALLMAGGPASVYAPRAWDAFQEFAPPSRPFDAEPAPTHAHDDSCRRHEIGEEVVLVAGASHRYHVIEAAGRTRCGAEVASDGITCPRVVADADGFTVCPECADRAG